MKAELGIFPKNRQILKDIVPLDTPLAVDIHMTHLCNFKCTYCILSQSEEVFSKSGLKREQMDWEVFELLVKQLQEFPRKIKMVTMSGIGECTIHPRLIDMIKLLRDSNAVETIQIITNGARLTPQLSNQLVEAGLNELRISLQGLSEKKYMEIADYKLNWEEYYSNICYFSKIRGNCKLKVKIADTALEPGDEEKFYALFGDICDAVAIEHIYDAFTQNGYIVNGKQSQLTRYGRELKSINVCCRPFTRIDILPDGSYTQFCHVNFGFEKNIKEKSIREQWNSRGQNKLREDMLRYGIEKFPKCQICEVREYTWHPEDILDGHEEEILERMRQKGMLDES